MIARTFFPSHHGHRPQAATGRRHRQLWAAALLLALLAGPAAATPRPVELHERLAAPPDAPHQVALTLDACSGRYDAALIDFLIRRRIPATIFATKRWLDANPAGLAVLNAHRDLFDIEDHGERHIPAVIGSGRKVYGIAGEPDLAHLRREVSEGARAVAAATGVVPRWYRGATAVYDPQALAEIGRLGYKVAGFSVNADAGATLGKAAIVARLHQVRDGDVIIAHMNKPASASAAGLADGLGDLADRGYRFVRLDQADLDRPQAAAGR